MSTDSANAPRAERSGPATPTTPAAPAPPELANYRVGELLGRGGMGDVYAAHHLRLDRPVAVKFIAAALRGDQQFVERFLREARLMARMDHPNIVRVFDCGEEQGQPYLVMERLHGETLRDRMKTRALTEREAVEVASAMLAGLSRAHAVGVVHRDIKPGNIHLGGDGSVKVMDFGIAKAASDAHLTETGAQIGTAEYMSPEQAEGRDIDARCDLYSVGVVLYQMLSGETPFSGDNSLAVLHQQVHKAPPPLPATVSPWLRAVVDRALAKDRNKRYQCAGDMKLALDEGLAASAVSADDRTRTSRRNVSKPRPRVSPLAPITAVLIVLGAGAAVTPFGVRWLRHADHHSALGGGSLSGSDRTRSGGGAHASSTDAGADQAMHLLTSGRTAEAEQAARDAVGRNPNDAGAQALLGNALLERAMDAGDRRVAADGLQHVRQAAAIDRELPMVSVGFANWDAIEHKYSDAIQFLQRAVQREPRLAYAFNQLGIVRLMTNDVTGALSAFQKAAALDPGMAWTDANAAEALRRLKRYPEAEAAAQACIDAYPQRSSGYLELGAALDADGKRADAEKAYRNGIAAARDGKPGALHAFLAANLKAQRRAADAHAEAAEARKAGYSAAALADLGL